MSERSSPKRSMRGFAVGVDLALFTPSDGELGVLLRSGQDERTRSRLSLPSAMLGADETLDDRVLALARDVAGTTPSVLEQVAALGPSRQTSAEAQKLTVLYFGLLPAGTSIRSAYTWLDVSEPAPSLPPRQRDEVDAALATLRGRVDHHPIAFRLLPAAFTLSELQRLYELLLGRKLHKASFRRALHAASLVEATDEWRSDGRGRPAQLFRYAPPRRRRPRRGVRFDALA